MYFLAAFILGLSLPVLVIHAWIYRNKQPKELRKHVISKCQSSWKSLMRALESSAISIDIRSCNHRVSESLRQTNGGPGQMLEYD
jgi:hypothetical protein